MGDAACAFNPVFQQGMSTALLGALALRTTLEGRRRRHRARHFQRALAKVNRTPWSLATAQDLRIADATGSSVGLRERVLQRSLARVGALSTSSVGARLALFRVINMIASPRALLRPSLWAVRIRSREIVEGTQRVRGGMRT